MSRRSPASRRKTSKAAARLYAKANRASILYAMGITQHITGTDNVKSCANLAMLCGKVGIEGGGVNPLRGQNNVQGACDMGALPNVCPAYQPVANDEARAKFEKAWNVTLPAKPGLTIVEMHGCRPRRERSRPSMSWAKTRCSPIPTSPTWRRR